MTHSPAWPYYKTLRILFYTKVIQLNIFNYRKKRTKYPPPPSLNQCFFFPRKSKVPVKPIFWHFCHFFHGWEFIFTHAFYDFFTDSTKFSRTLFKIFSRIDFFFHGRKNEKFLLFWRKKLSIFFHLQSFFSRMGFRRNFHGELRSFTDKKLTFSRKAFFFTGKKKNTGTSIVKCNQKESTIGTTRMI